MDLTDLEFDEFTKLVNDASGIKIDSSKKYLLKQRLAPIVKNRGEGSYSLLLGKLKLAQNRELRDIVIDALTTNETLFFRDIHPFEIFTKTVLPILGEMIVERKKNVPYVRKGAKAAIWCAASSTGQEPYTIAMLVHEYAMANSYRGISADDFSILATDISSKALAHAVAGVYTDIEVARGLSEQRCMKYFKNKNGKWELNDFILKMVDFRRVNLTESFGMLGGFDFIFCRNVLIYFSDETKQKIFKQFHSILPKGGMLMLGSSENPGLVTDYFEPVRDGKTIIFRNKG